MKLAIVYGEVSTRHQLIIERAQDIFESVLAAPIDGISFVHGEDDTSVMYKGTDLTEFDAVYIRTSDRDVFFAEHLAEVLNESGVITQAANDTYSYESNKFFSMQLLAENDLNCPDSVYTVSPSTAIQAADELGYPVIMKTVQGGGGEGVMRASSEKELKPIMDALSSFEQDICLQEFLEHSGEDTRVIVIGEHAVAYRRSSEGDEWRSNLGTGGSREDAELNEEMKQIAVKTANAFGFDMCGIDMIENEGEYYILEVNGSYGIHEEINELVGEDIILRMVERLHERALDAQN